MSLKNKKIFICGHKGMVGNSLLNYLKNKKFKNIIIKDKKKLDLSNYNQVNKFIKKNKPDFIINCAGKVGGILANSLDPLNFLLQNIEIQLNILKSCMENNIKYFINLGSSCIYPKYSLQPISEKYLLDGKLEKTNEGYALAKIVGLKACEYYNMKFNKFYFTLMPCNLYGPNDEFDLKKSHFLPALIKKFHKSKKNNLVEIWGSGKAKREVMFVDDLADAIYFFMNKIYKKDKKFLMFIKKNHFLNVGTGEDFSIKKYAHIVKNIINPKAKIRFNSKFPDGTPRKLLDIKNLNYLGWSHKTKLKKGIELTYIWAKNKKEI